MITLVSGSLCKVLTHQLVKLGFLWSTALSSGVVLQVRLPFSVSHHCTSVYLIACLAFGHSASLGEEAEENDGKKYTHKHKNREVRMILNS